MRGGSRSRGRTPAPVVLAAVAVLAGAMASDGPLHAQARPRTAENRGWWRDDPLYREIARRLDAVKAIDNHVHLLDKPAFNPAFDLFQPPGLRSTNPALARALEQRFGVPPGLPLPQAVEKAAAARAAMVARLGEAGYWADHLDAVGTEIALVNQNRPDGTDGGRLRWVPHATNLLYPLPADGFVREPGTKGDIEGIQRELRHLLEEAGRSAVPPDLAGYEAFVDETLARWRSQGAVAVKLWDAYLRTLRFEDVTEERAGKLYARAVSSPLPRGEYLAVQDRLARRVFARAGELKLPVHVHSSYGAGSTLRLQEADPRNLENVIIDPRLQQTRFVLIHGGGPLFHEAAYLGASKPNVWIDVSAMDFLYPVPDLAAVLRTYIVMAPEKVLFSTDVSGYPGVPVDPEVQHVAVSRIEREALYLALAGLVRDEFTDLEGAARIGRGVLRGNAAALYGWPD
ncbi:MAG TPA: amidohydrolase family protein [Vicinamibacteria bacterium]|nr:amidohydrolase family protein [Vicinamibacteria bacterium]